VVHEPDVGEDRPDRWMMRRHHAPDHRTS
jgi:hypothetical protein